MWTIEYTDEFGNWWETLDESVQDAVDFSVGLLTKLGPALGRPHADVIKQSRHGNMKELRTQHRGKPYRIFFAFDPRRSAILLIGGCKAGDKRFYDRMIPLADELYDVYLAELRKEGLI
ncbi:MAG TPA: type II toxin-antitoxin system RelE/ParE family toxin [Tepidisphaeraceae bacterium]|jgi:hypothetical protein|nr:type II toxin-antitoxin system RelE/ParE family toxin [Tepidisphaeraceae bacterium]